MHSSLPILEIIPDIKKSLSQHNILILQAPPGAGKSTILPLQLLHEPWLMGKKILMLEPRRLAAKAVAQRMASILQEPVGKTVGYRVRLENKISEDTCIEVVTEGILTRMIQNDNALEKVGLVIFDEFHERSLHADLGLALCREIQQILREDLKIMIMSATLDGEKLSSLLDNAPILTSLGRQYPIDIQYWPQAQAINIPTQVAKAIQKVLTVYEGDILVFLPGAGEIRKTQEILETAYIEADVYPLYGDLPIRQQQLAIQPHSQGQRKIVLATSIAETSLTIEGIKIVIDSGYARTPRFDPKTGLTRLETIRVTKDVADQRAGRAGRLGPGVCLRLWSEGSQQYLMANRSPEIMEADLTSMTLELIHWGVQDFARLAWLTPPPSGATMQAKELLTRLGAIENNLITTKGKELLRLPAHPRIAHLLLKAKEYHLIALGCDIAALLEERDPLSREAGADLYLRIESLRRWRNKEYVNTNRHTLERVENLAAFWRKIFKTEPDNLFPDPTHIGKLLAVAYPERIAKQLDHNPHCYRLANGRIARLDEQDLLFQETWIAIAHLDAGKHEGKVFLAAPLNPDDVMELTYEKKTVNWNEQKGILIAQTEQRLGDIIIKSSTLDHIEEEIRINILCEVVRKEGLKLFTLTNDFITWQNRLLSLKAWRPHENWPDVSDENLLHTIETWLGPYLNNVKRREDFLKIDLNSILMSTISWDTQQSLQKLVPEIIKVPSGSMIKLEYKADGSAPILAVRLQEVFGLLDTPTVNEGRQKVLLHLLSPGYKPVQVTQDLKSFWQNTYPEVRKELRVRYQKHHWPEDPWTAEAVRGVKKRNL